MFNLFSAIGDPVQWKALLVFILKVLLMIAEFILKP